ncbi:MAG: alpha-L-arabinofuranosidase C-terminal domain-containing protein [Chloroflexota bacterium]|nr:alpha-L-arabinofuranosidase C-terminal domain-containing protein [Chloroflexota bacterium]
MKQASVRVRLDRPRGRIHPYVYGQFIEHMGRCIYGGVFEPGSPLADERGFRRDVLEAMRGLRIPIMRYPGGCFSDEYHWRDGVGPREKRPHYPEQYWTRALRGLNRPHLAPLIGPPETNAFGTDEYLALCAELNIAPYLNVNHGSDTPEEAAEWVAYCNRRPDSPRKVAVVGVGNEVYGPWETGHRSGDEYGRHFLQYAEAIRRVDADVKLLAVGAQKVFAGFTEGMLKAAGPTMDYVSVHSFYPALAGMRKLRDDEADYWAVAAAPYALIRNVDEVFEVIDRVLGPDSPVRVSFDEWTLWCDWDECVATNYDLRAGLFFAGTFHRIHERAPRLEIAAIAQLVNMLGLIQTNDSGLFLTAGYLVNRLYVEETRPLALESTVESETFDSPIWPEAPDNVRAFLGEDLKGIPYLDASATVTEDGRELAVFLINRHLAEPLDVILAIEGALRSPQDRRLRLLSGDGPFARNDFEHPQRLRIEERPVAAEGNRLRVELPPHSVGALVLV